jgi:DNA topoisomerase-1
MTRAKRDVVKAIDAVAGVLGNTPAVCRKSYIHPAVIDAYMDGSMAELRPTTRFAKLRSDEAAALCILQQLARGASRKRKAA